MPTARPLPKKFLSQLEEAQGILKRIAYQSRSIIDDIQGVRSPSAQIQNTLREIETNAYRVALDLSLLDVAGTCDECPAAPPITKVQAHLLVLADQLEKQAMTARSCVLEPQDLASSRDLNIEISK